jgi:RNA polymerase sigma-70 factor (ECF subfamily)
LQRSEDVGHGDAAPPLAETIEELALSRRRFLAFVRRQVSDEARAEDILQTALTRAVAGLPSLRQQERLLPWFYAILRNAITDSYRQNSRREVPLPADLDLEQEQYQEQRVCECFQPLLSTLKPEYATVIQALDLEGEPAATVAARLGVRPDNLKVRHHRARRALRRKLEQTCRVCAEHRCLDCTCSLP